MDGDVATDEGGDRRVVWGSEYPELIITETLAMHDRRVIDSDKDDGPGEKRWIKHGEEDQTGDPDLDQFRIPQGSLFIELYNSRGPSTDAQQHDGPRELYNEDHSLDLGRLAPLGNDSLQHPVWRIAITRTSASRVATERTDITDFQPADREIERIIWLATSDPAGYPHEDRVYYNRNRAQAPTVGRGQYVVLGPGDRLRGRRVEIRTAAKPPAEWINTARTAPEGIGLSISAPLPQTSHYPEPTVQTGDGISDTYGAIGEVAGNLPDQPFDNQAGRLLAEFGLSKSGTLLDVRSALLQRLANPLRPHDPLRNPYITVDWATIDLTVFNSQDQRPPGYPVEELGPFDRSFSSAPDLGSSNGCPT